MNRRSQRSVGDYGHCHTYLRTLSLIQLLKTGHQRPQQMRQWDRRTFSTTKERPGKHRISLYRRYLMKILFLIQKVTQRSSVLRNLLMPAYSP